MIAANGPLAQENGPVGTFPTQTLASLPQEGVVFYVVLGARGELASVDSGYPSRQLPLQLGDAEVKPRWEGQPNSDVPEYTLTAAVHGYNVVVYAFFGTQTLSAAQMAAAQDELNRLQVPSA